MQLLNIFGCILLAGCLSINTVKALRCYECNSDDEELCINQQNGDTDQKCRLSDTECFTLKFGDDIFRGCKSDIPAECTVNSKKCIIEYCDSNACNKYIFPKPLPKLKCYQCSGEGCASTSEIMAILCNNYSEEEQCYSLVDSKKNVLRGCTSDKNSPCPGDGCDVCEKNGCNFKTYKEDTPKLKCYQCSGKDCLTVLKAPELCERYDEKDQCYAYVDDKKNVFRGCISDLDSPCPGNKGCDICENPACNNKSYKEDKLTLKCYQCSGARCASTSDMNSILCKNYSEEDECYFHLDSKKNVFRGCTSDENSPCPGFECDVCHTNGCNFKLYKEDTPKLKCYQCSGKDCLTDLKAPELCERYDEEDQCYTYVLDKKNVLRGCTSDKGSLCPGSGCDVCNTNGCNSKPYKEDTPKLKCYQCSGKDCLTDLKAPELCERYDEKDQCYTYVFDKKNVLRGCLSDEDSLCPGKGCDVCNTNGCNSKTYKEDTPKLKCYQCSGKDCLTDLKAPELCERYDEVDQCYTYVDEQKNVFRGCTSDVKSHCKDRFCVTCEGEGCNTQSEIIQYSCNVCTGNSKSCMGESGRNGVCSVSTPGKCTTLLGREQNCFTYHEINKFERGCGEKLKQSHDTKFLETCFGKNCNSKCVTNCYECQSNNDSRCKNELSQVPKVSCFDTSYCHECEDEQGLITRGCKRNEDKTCINCVNNHFCNQNTSRSCITCSSAYDQSCTLITDVLKPISLECERIFDPCVSKLLKNQTTVRGCATEVGPCGDEFSLSCETCKTDLCNTNLIPANRVLCHKCNDNTDCPKEQVFQKAKLCEKYNGLENECFSVNLKDKVVRGCKSDEEHHICNENKDKCQYCTNPLGCNSAVSESSYKCITCNNDNECGWAQDAEKAEECTFEFMEPLCFTQILGKKIVRGCLTNDVCNDIDGPKCYTCKGDACNKLPVFHQTCIQCDSTKNKNCAEANGIKATLCTAEQTYFSNSGCYTMRDGDKIIRGCVTELEQKVKDECESKDNKYCNICKEQRCNNEKAPTESKPPVKCIECNDEKHCPWSYDEDLAKECKVSKCFTYQHGNGTVTRGCGDSEFVCDPKDEKCAICHDNACNKENAASFECFQCKSDQKDQKSCADKAEHIESTQCKGLSTYETRGCYTKTEKKIVSRGCILGLNAEELKDCTADKKGKKCIMCLENKCNNQSAPDSGSHLTHFSFVSLIIISAFITFKNQI